MITVIVPVYNIKDYLPRCVRSITAQTYSRLEIMLGAEGAVPPVHQQLFHEFPVIQHSGLLGRGADVRQRIPLLIDLVPGHLGRGYPKFPNPPHPSAPS